MTYTVAWALLLALVSPILSHSAVAQSERAREAVRDVARVVVVQGPATSASRDLLDGFRRRLEHLGRRADIVVVESDGPSPDAAGKRVAASADLVLALGSRATAYAATEFHAVPTIGALLARESAMPVGSGATAVVLEFSVESELEWMRRILPRVRRVGVLFSSDDNARLVARSRDIAKGLGLELVARRVTNPSDIPAALAALSASADVIWGVPDDVVLTAETAKAVLLASLRSRVPFVGLSAQWVRAGATYALDRDYADLGAQTADLAVRLLDGSTSRAVAAVHPRKILYSLNARSADMMRLTISQALLRGATEVVR